MFQGDVLVFLPHAPRKPKLLGLVAAEKQLPHDPVRVNVGKAPDDSVANAGGIRLLPAVRMEAGIADWIAARVELMVGVVRPALQKDLVPEDRALRSDKRLGGRVVRLRAMIPPRIMSPNWQPLVS